MFSVCILTPHIMVVGCRYSLCCVCMHGVLCILDVANLMRIVPASGSLVI